MNQQKRISILTRLYDENPRATTNLIFNSPFELLISVLLSARSTDISVNKATKKLFLVANTAEKILALDIHQLKSYIKTIGLFNTKAENIIKTCQILIEKYNGEIPESRTALESLPGVGRKTANVVLNIVFGWPTIAVDTHVFRVCNRTHFATGKNVIEIEQKLIDLVPTKFKFNCHYLFLLHGRYVCTAKKPKCNFCIIKDLCEFNKKTII